MSKNIIISGPRASGKSRIAKAIASTHQNVIQTTYFNFKQRLYKGFPINLSSQYRLIIIDECTKEDILEISLNDISGLNMDLWTDKILGEDEISFVFITQDKISPKIIGHGHFLIINCNNDKY